MAIFGDAIIPLAMGWLADRCGLQHAFLLPMLCDLYIMFHAWQGSRVRGDAAASASASATTG